MFDKYKERKQRLEQVIQDFEATHDSVRKTRAHVVKHRGKYCTVIAVGGTIVVTRQFGMLSLSTTTSSVSGVIEAAQNASATFGDVSDTATVMVDQSLTVYQQFGGHCCKIIQDAADPTKMWPMFKTFCEQVAEANNTTPDKVSRMAYRYWEGKLDHVYGHCPVRYGVTTTGVAAA